MRTIIKLFPACSVVALLLLYQSGYSQPKDSIKNDLLILAAAKYKYEKFKKIEESNKTAESLTKKKEAYEAYVNQTRKIKNNPEIYLNYIERELHNPALSAGPRLPYNYFETYLPFNPDYYLVTKRDFYLVVKFSLFDRDMDILPEKLDGIPLIDRPDDISPHAKPQTLEDIIREPADH
ncbi:hypothetical protein [Albibacterium profundi]|uniref:Uncharacterized protein n=1 Tax=Albibacterium profundi TaxID=3134906 RepID=A0ABV5CE78_9SPHI